MTAVSAELIIETARTWYPGAADNEHTMLGVLRARAASFVPTWLSALAASGVPLPPRYREEIAACTDRVSAFRTLVERLGRAFPEVRPVKGVGVVDLYPAGLVRHMNDVDLVAPSPRVAWDVVRFLADQFDMTIAKSIALFPLGDADGLMVSVEAAPRHPLAQRMNVEITTAAWLGDGAAVPALATWPVEEFGPAGHFLMIVAEGLEGAYSLKDLIDAAVLIEAMSPAELRHAADLVDRLRVRPECARLLRLLDDAGLPAPAQLATGDRGARWARAAAAGAAFARRPWASTLRLLQRAEMFDCALAKPRLRAWRLADRVLPVRSPVRARLWRFGVPVKLSEPPWEGALRTPLGDFLAVNSGVVGPQWQRVAGVSFDV